VENLNLWPKHTLPNTGTGPVPARETATEQKPAMTDPKAEPDVNLAKSNQSKKSDIDPNRNKLPNPKHPKTQLSQLPTPGPTVNPNYPNPNYSEMPSIFLPHGNPSLLKNPTPERVVSIRIDTDRSDPLSPPKPVQQHSVNYNYH
jgi:hypothetical protein